ncbi:MAG: SGNH/GDSL hydrolase family protein [Clostridia bacterium]|nr:SGNH/GDSL hydrolase family protein [Clostridia bacterium]
MNFKDKKILFLGDSITALNTTERGWVRYFNEIIMPESFVNLAVSGARLSNSAEPVEFDGDPVFRGENTDYRQNVVLNQIEKLSRGKNADNKHFNRNPDYDGFDIIIIAAGTNDWFCKEKFDIEAIESQFTENGEVIPLEKVNCFTFAGAMRFIYEKLRGFYPDSKIFFCSPIQAAEAKRPYDSILYKRNLMRAVCDRLSDAVFIDTFNCGICGIYEKNEENGRDLIDGLHPNADGAKKIGLFNARAIKRYFD